MVYVTGDLHGAVDIRKLSSRSFDDGEYLTKHDYLIILGDFGMLWENGHDAEEEYWLTWLAKKPWTTLFVDGNHENHPRLYALDKVEMFGGTVGKVNDSIFHLKRGEVYDIDGNTFFVMGGAYSIDKAGRKDGISWWKEEIPTREEFEYGLDNLDKCGWKVDYVLGHTGPNSILTKYLSQFHMPDLYCKLDDVAKYFDVVIERLEFKKFYFGHMHDNAIIDKKYVMLYEDIVLLGEVPKYE